MTLSASERERIVSSPVFARISPEVQNDLLEATSVGSWGPGEHVIREGAESRALFVILEGTVRVTVHSGAKDVILAELGPGEVFGEEGLLAGAARAATVTASSNVRCAVMPARALDAHLERAPAVRQDLERLSARRFHERLVSSVAALHGLQLEGTQQSDVSRVAFQAGAHIVVQGQPSDAVFFILTGIAIATKQEDRPGSPVVLTRVGPGQCVGEIGVIRRAPRAASVLAETKVEAIRVEADRFRDWVSNNPRFADYLGTLERIYPLADGRLLSVYRSEHNGREAVTTLAGDPAGECVLSTKVLGENTLLLARGSTEFEGERDSVCHAQADGGMERELLLDNVERGPQGQILHARICGVQVQGIDLDVPHLYQALRTRQLITGKEIKRFQRTGFLGGQTRAADASNVCSCLGIGKLELLSALQEHGPEMESVSAAIGLGAVCGACLPRAHEIASNTSAAPAAGSAFGETEAGVESTLIARRPEIDFDVDALLKLSADFELHAVAVASIFATAGEQFMVQQIGEALPTLDDPSLVADAVVFLEQEGHHISVHEPLNKLFLERIYPRSRALRRCSRGMVGGSRWLPKNAALAVGAAFEHIADCNFATFADEYYGQGRRYSPDPVVHELVKRSGAGPLFLWHCGEEMSHRHVAFDIMQACGGGWFSRLIGFSFLVFQAIVLLIPALLSLRLVSRGRPQPSTSSRSGLGPMMVLKTALRGLRFLRPSFHPNQEHYPYLAELASDMEKLPEA